MLISDALVLARTPEEYKAVLAHSAIHKTLDPKAKLAYLNVFHFHPHQHPDLAKIVAEEHPLDRLHPFALTLSRRPTASEGESGTPVEIPASGPIQDVPTSGIWEGFGDIRIMVRRRTKFR